MSDAMPFSPTSDDSGIRGHDGDEPNEKDVWPVYSGKSFDIWRPDTGDYYDSANASSVVAHLQEKRRRQHRVLSSAFAEMGAETMNLPSTLPCLHPRIAFRDVTNPTNTRTLIAALVPRHRVVTHKAPYLLRIRGEALDEAFVLGVLSSMVFDWQSRRTVELNMTFEQIGLLTIPDPGAGHPVRDRSAAIAARLAACDDRFTDWASEVGVPVGSANDEAVKQDLICELDACVAHLYGLDEADLAVIYETFSETVDYSDRHAAVLAHLRRITG
ncbi:MAG: hypothetical protein F4Y27_11410 [Acidimicrobiaceae bacterium]|nr:hypothetical protein [Acidimicrobiaceae bacterium]MXW62780.1 hypothetical protein [Acidimicrobiaceae bacterium]MXW76648.1 hypothetical protein [Acidimicrobiaceae bacterium]MYA75270.1 hypothetical protein [Acidimicrobiaceae bacterium]MYC43096.1 hypothetical protein [Acidimicrobiaceae bacterium]